MYGKGVCLNQFSKILLLFIFGYIRLPRNSISGGKMVENTQPHVRLQSASEMGHVTDAHSCFDAVSRW